MKELYIAVDTGKSATKAVFKIGDNIEKIIFRTKVQEILDLGVDITPNSYKVEFQGKSFLIGDMVSENSCNYQITKNTIDHKLCLLIAICKMIEISKAMCYGLPKIHLALNIPLNLFKNSTLKNEYQSFMQNNGEIVSIKVNDIAYAFRICSILILPEAIGPLYVRTNDFRSKKVTVIDIGSLNISYCTFNKLIPALDSMNVSNGGINVLRSKIAETLTSTYGILVTDEDVDEVLQNEYLYVAGIRKTESREIIKKLLAKHVSEIFNYGRSRGITFNNSNLIFVGGGSLLLREFILAEYPLAIFENYPEFTNCLSFLNVLEVKNAK